ncbi:MAG TPA: type I-MYXAN CRISPR-associated protein Cas6/Cmx6 [Leucothrix sp.]|nr:type I-MYXAN CRISPR-associated protein Cas6/Cmx6 [Leucothrix sp.]
MFWQEDEDKNLPYEASEDVIDLSFAIQCKTLPLDHAWALSREIIKHLPWMDNHTIAGIHQIHVAESNNGWLRPDEDDNALLYPSRRTKMTLRIPTEKQLEAYSLTGMVLNINGHPIEIRNAKKKVFTNAGVLFSRYVLSNDKEDENSFLSRMASEIENKTNHKVKKMLCGKSHIIKTPDGILNTKHLMIADLDNDTSIKIQQLGLGEGKHLGCGIFLPHKGIKSLVAGE